MLTLDNLKQFHEQLNQINVLCNEMIKIRTEERLFKNSDDYYLTLDICKWYPADYFQFRMFDTRFVLKHNNRQKIFYGHFESISKVRFYHSVELNDFCKKHNIKINAQINQLQFEKDKSFEQITREWIYIIKLFIQYILTEDKLFDLYELQ